MKSIKQLFRRICIYPRLSIVNELYLGRIELISLHALGGPPSDNWQLDPVEKFRVIFIVFNRDFSFKF
jgi:hypothetical protein